MNKFDRINTKKDIDKTAKQKVLPTIVRNKRKVADSWMPRILGNKHENCRYCLKHIKKGSEEAKTMTFGTCTDCPVYCSATGCPMLADNSLGKYGTFFSGMCIHHSKLMTKKGRQHNWAPQCAIRKHVNPFPLPKLESNEMKKTEAELSEKFRSTAYQQLKDLMLRKMMEKLQLDHFKQVCNPDADENDPSMLLGDAPSYEIKECIDNATKCTLRRGNRHGFSTATKIDVVIDMELEFLATINKPDQGTKAETTVVHNAADMFKSCYKGELEDLSKCDDRTFKISLNKSFSAPNARIAKVDKNKLVIRINDDAIAELNDQVRQKCRVLTSRANDAISTINVKLLKHNATLRHASLRPKIHTSVFNIPLLDCEEKDEADTSQDVTDLDTKIDAIEKENIKRRKSTGDNNKSGDHDNAWKFRPYHKFVQKAHCLQNIGTKRALEYGNVKIETVFDSQTNQYVPPVPDPKAVKGRKRKLRNCKRRRMNGKSHTGLKENVNCAIAVSEIPFSMMTCVNGALLQHSLISEIEVSFVATAPCATKKRKVSRTANTNDCLDTCRWGDSMLGACAVNIDDVTMLIDKTWNVIQMASKAILHNLVVSRKKKCNSRFAEEVKDTTSDFLVDDLLQCGDIVDLRAPKPENVFNDLLDCWQNDIELWDMFRNYINKIFDKHVHVSIM